MCPDNLRYEPKTYPLSFAVIITNKIRIGLNKRELIIRIDN